MAEPSVWEMDVTAVAGIAPARRAQLERLGIRTVGDLLWHLPHRYEEFSGWKRIADLVEGQIQTVIGEVVEITGRQSARGREIVSVVVTDDGASMLEAVWFNQPWRTEKFHYGQVVALTGKVRWFRDHWQMSMPDVQPAETTALESRYQIVPVYPLTEDLPAESLRRLIAKAVERFAGKLDELLPPELRHRRSLPTIAEAIRQVHMPKSLDEAQRGRRRLVYEELLILQLALAVRRRDFRLNRKAPIIQVTTKIDHRIRRLFPFRLTGDQDKAIADIVRDLGQERPMQRLLQADVGAGKTVVAVYALLAAIANGYQVAMMAPTEVLVRQHWRTIENLLQHSRVRRVLLTGSIPPRSKRIALDEIERGTADLIVGTTALVQEAVRFRNLGLVVVDEQHKFGVEQRARIRSLGVEPHYLVMTATPIPRTLALTTFGDLDVTTIKEMPPGRHPVQTSWVYERERSEVYDRIVQKLRQGRQLFIVCPLVEESERLQLKNAEQVYQELQTGPLGEFRIGLIHGRMDDRAKDDVMLQFRQGKIQVLVSTLVIEVGVDVPNATLMIIEHADRFGLSQLHQLRGRIARGTEPGECYCFADNITPEAEQRLSIFVRTQDGFRLAEEDAKLRGLGEFFGTRQHGWGDLRIADLQRDRDVLLEARHDAFHLVKNDPGLADPEHQLLRQTLVRRYGESLRLAEIG